MRLLPLILSSVCQSPRVLCGAVLTLGLATASGEHAVAQTPEAVSVASLQERRPQPLPPDRTATLPPRRADAARLRELAAQREFQYVEAAAPPDGWGAFWARMRRWLRDLFSTPTGRFTWKYGIYTLALAALVFAVLKLLKLDITGAFGRAARRSAMPYDTATENIHEVDFAARLTEAEAAGNYRLATRLGYLEVLKRLTDRDLIHWQPDKTNHAYLAELPAGPTREAFRAATREFEYVWYGELALHAALYQQARATQRAVTNTLPHSRTNQLAAASTQLSQPA